MCDILSPSSIKGLKDVQEPFKEWADKIISVPLVEFFKKTVLQIFCKIPRKSFATEGILKAHNYTEHEFCCCFSRNFPKILRTAILKEKLPMNVPYFIKEKLWMSASDEATVKKIIGGSKSSSKLTLKTKSCHNCGCCDDSQSCEQLKKHVTDNHFEKKC